MKFLKAIVKRLCCRHSLYISLTNLHGDFVNQYNARNIQICVYCGKKRKSWEIDHHCDYINFEHIDKG